MHEANDPGVLDLAEARVRLRDDLQFAANQFGDRPCYVIEDPLTSRYFRIGVDEYYFLSLLDGDTTVGEAVALTAKSRGRDAFTQIDAAVICRWLLDNNLATTEASLQPRRLLAAARQSAQRRFAAALNPLLIKVPLGNPDRALERMLPLLGWLLGGPVLILWTIVVTVGLYHVASQLDRFRAASVGILAPGNWLGLGICWAVLKVVHELAHALTCKKYGGSVLEWGLVFILFTPVAYVDATGAWRLKSKWQRIGTSGAGMYAELFCAAIAALVWSYSPPGMTSHLAYNVVVMAGFSTLLVNGNPLMRFDAYYMLADFLEIPNLSARGQQYVRYVGRRYLLGIPADPPAAPLAALICLYGIAAWFWRLLVLGGLLLAAHALFLGAGLIVAVAGAAAWFGLPALRLGKYLAVGNTLERPRTPRVVAVAATGGALPWLLWTAVPWPGVVAAPAVVQASPHSVIRGEVPGFVSQVLVRNNQQVEVGQILIRLENEELLTELKDLELEIQETNLLRDQLRQNQELAAAQIQTQFLAALHTRLTEKRGEFAQLTIRAPIGGRAIRRNPQSLLGTYVEPGTELLAIAGQDTQLALSISEDDFELFSRRVGQPVRVRYQGSSRILSARVQRVRPNASRELPALALAATAGGPLPVQPVSAPGTRSAAGASADYQLISPRFEGLAQLVTSSPHPNTTGQVARVWFRSHHETVGQHIYHNVSRWIGNRLQAAHDPRN